MLPEASLSDWPTPLQSHLLIVRDDDRADDAVQQALITAWLDIRGLRDPDRFDAWIYRILVRACYRTARRERSKRSRSGPGGARAWRGWPPPWSSP